MREDLIHRFHESYALLPKATPLVVMHASDMLVYIYIHVYIHIYIDTAK